MDEIKIRELISTLPLSKLLESALVEDPSNQLENHSDKSTCKDLDGELNIKYLNFENIAINGYNKCSPMLVLSQTYSPYWIATVNGKKTSTFPTYYTFTGIPIPRGRFQIKFKYMPPTLLGSF